MFWNTSKIKHIWLHTAWAGELYSSPKDITENTDQKWDLKTIGFKFQAEEFSFSYQTLLLCSFSYPWIIHTKCSDENIVRH